MAAHSLVVTVSGESREPDQRGALVGGTVLYLAMLAAALGWLWLRGRGRQLEILAVGEAGPVLGAAVGLGTGLLGAFALARCGRWSRSLRAVEDQARAMFHGIGEVEAIAFVTTAAIAEEAFFRLAVQDLAGLTGSVAAYVLLNTSVGGIGVAPITVVHALVLGTLVKSGFGLLGSTTAHAIMNYLSLRRVLCS